LGALEAWNHGNVSAQLESGLAFVSAPEDAPGIEIRVPFGALTGRTVMLAEIDRLAAWLLDEVGAVTVVAEDRHEIGRNAEASIHQVRIDVSEADVPTAPTARQELERRLLERVDYWVRRCFADRHADLIDFTLPLA
jgi:hypothetical protein